MVEHEGRMVISQSVFQTQIMRAQVHYLVLRETGLENHAVAALDHHFKFY